MGGLDRERTVAPRDLLRKAFILAALTLNACVTKPATVTVAGAAFPTASQLTPKPLPAGVSWHGRWSITTPGSRGTLHILMRSGGFGATFAGASDEFDGCWIAEDKHARATFIGRTRDNIAMFHWTQKRIGFEGEPKGVSAYLVLEPVEDGRHRIKGEYGPDLSYDAGDVWQGIKQDNEEPKADGCRLDDGSSEP